MPLTPGRFVGETLDLRATSSQRAMPSTTVAGIGGVGFSPLSLGGLIGWWDASDTATITSSSGAVSQWDDKSGCGHHLAQSTSTNQPTTGTVTQNGLNVIRFDGSNDRLIRNPFTIGIHALTIAFVARENSETNGGFVTPYATGNDYGNAGNLSINAAATASLHMESANNGVLGASISGTGATPLAAYAITKSGQWAAFSKNNASYANIGSSNHSATSANSSQLYVGVRFYSSAFQNHLNGDIMEIIVVSRPIMSGEMSALMRYLTVKWGI